MYHNKDLQSFISIEEVVTIKKMPLLAQRSLMSSASRVLDTVQEGGGVSTFKKKIVLVFLHLMLHVYGS